MSIGGSGWYETTIEGIEQEHDEEVQQFVNMMEGVLNGTITSCTAKTWLKLNYSEYVAKDAAYG